MDIENIIENRAEDDDSGCAIAWAILTGMREVAESIYALGNNHADTRLGAIEGLGKQFERIADVVERGMTVRVEREIEVDD